MSKNPLCTIGTSVTLKIVLALHPPTKVRPLLKNPAASQGFFPEFRRGRPCGCVQGGCTRSRASSEETPGGKIGPPSILGRRMNAIQGPQSNMVSGRRGVVKPGEG